MNFFNVPLFLPVSVVVTYLDLSLNIVRTKLKKEVNNVMIMNIRKYKIPIELLIINKV
jgi:hypothetical protein